MIIIVCASKDKNCGIARYSTYVEYFLRRAGHKVVTVSRVDAISRLPVSFLSRISHVFVQHEYGLFDGDVNKSLWAGESTRYASRCMSRLVDFGIPVTVLMHTVEFLSRKLTNRNQILFDSGATVATLNPVCSQVTGMPFVEHGIPLFEDRQEEAWGEPCLMHFGILSGLKRVDLLFDLSEETGLPLNVNLAGGRVEDVDVVNRLLRKYSSKHTFTFGFMDEATMLHRWRGRRGVFVNAQADIRGYYASSGSTRFAMNFGCPIVCTGSLQHAGLESVVCVSADELGPAIEDATRNPSLANHVLKEAREKSILSVYGRYLNG